MIVKKYYKYKSGIVCANYFVHKDADILQAAVYQRWQLGPL